MVDKEEAAELYRRYGPALFRRCRTLVGHDDDAHELVQETFFQFWRGRQRFEGRSAPFTFLYRIATNLSIDRLRRRTTAGESVMLDEARHEDQSSGPDRPSTALSELAVLTEGLDEQTLTIAVMSHVDGLTQE
ncbi:MAG: RNA polymerase sigma factor, partial [Myxococcota bacterium]